MTESKLETTGFGIALIKAVRAVAAANPDNRNARCVHVDDNWEPVCIIGHALNSLGMFDKSIDKDHYLGTITGVLSVFSSESGTTIKNGWATVTIKWPKVSKRELDWLGNVQSFADAVHGPAGDPRRPTWATAITRADEADAKFVAQFVPKLGQ